MTRKPHYVLNVLIAMLAAATALAQGPRGPRWSQPQIDMARQSTIEGTITSVNVACCMQSPSIEVNGVTVKVAPVWYLLGQGFELKAGDAVKITAAPCAGDSYLHAIEISKTATNLRITLRDAQGRPVWAGGCRRSR